MSRPMRDLLDAMRQTGCALQHPGLKGGTADDEHEARALAWHHDKHASDEANGFSGLANRRLQIAHIRSWPDIKGFSRYFPSLIAQL
jgi:hypothetical protein